MFTIHPKYAAPYESLYDMKIKTTRDAHGAYWVGLNHGYVAENVIQAIHAYGWTIKRAVHGTCGEVDADLYGSYIVDIPNAPKLEWGDYAVGLRHSNQELSVCLFFGAVTHEGYPMCVRRLTRRRRHTINVDLEHTLQDCFPKTIYWFRNDALNLYQRALVETPVTDEQVHALINTECVIRHRLRMFHSQMIWRAWSSSPVAYSGYNAWCLFQALGLLCTHPKFRPKQQFQFFPDLLPLIHQFTPLESTLTRILNDGAVSPQAHGILTVLAGPGAVQ